MADQKHFTAKKIENKGMCSRLTAREEWSEESSLRTDEQLSLAAGKIAFFPRETVPLYGSISHLIYSAPLCIRQHLDAAVLAQTLLPQEETGNCHCTQQQYTQGVRVFFPGKS